MGGIINVSHGDYTSLHIGEGKSLHLRIISRQDVESLDQVPQLALLLRIRRLVNFVEYQLGDKDVILV